MGPMDRLFYETYKDAGRSISLVLVVGMMFTIGIVGIIFNSALICVTVRTKSLHGTCNWLLAAAAACDVLHQLAHFTPLYLVLTGKNFIPVIQCIKAQFLPLTGLITMFGLLAFIALDRLFSILFPRASPRKLPYIATLVYLSLGFSGVINGLAYAEILENPQRPTTCIVAECYGPRTGGYFFLVLIVFGGLAAGCYLTIWIVMKKRQDSQNQATMRLFKSLLTILCFVIICYATTGVVGALLMPRMNSLQSWFTMMGLGMLINFAIAANAPILYFTSSEYRPRFQHLIKRVTRGLLFSERISSMQGNYTTGGGMGAATGTLAAGVAPRRGSNWTDPRVATTEKQ